MISYQDVGLSETDINTDMFFVIDVDSKKIEFASPAGHRKLGYGKGELIGLSAFDLHPHEMEEMMAFINDVSINDEASTNSLPCQTRGDFTRVDFGQSSDHWR